MNDQTPETELISILARLNDRDIPAHVALPAKKIWLVRIASLTALGDRDLLPGAFELAARDGVTPDEMQEAIYQTMAYAGISRARGAEVILRKTLAAKGLPAPKAQGTVDDKTRFDDGLKAQTTIFGNRILDMHKNARDDERFITVDLLTGFCFGDTYTRKAIDLKTRELLTFVIIASLGGCDPQVRAHVGGNIAMGTTRGELLECLSVMVPLIGFPKSLNTLAAINAVAPAKQ